MVKRLFLYLGIAIAFLVACALLLAVEIHTGIQITSRWLGLAVWTGFIVWFVAKRYRNSWVKPSFWLSVIALSGIHILAFTEILRSYPQWRPIWFIPTSAAELGICWLILDSLFAPRNGSG